VRTSVLHARVHHPYTRREVGKEGKEVKEEVSYKYRMTKVTKPGDVAKEVCGYGTRGNGDGINRPKQWISMQDEEKRIRVTNTESLSENLNEDEVLKYWLDETY